MYFEDRTHRMCEQVRCGVRKDEVPRGAAGFLTWTAGLAIVWMKEIARDIQAILPNKQTLPFLITSAIIHLIQATIISCLVVLIASKLVSLLHPHPSLVCSERSSHIDQKWKYVSLCDSSAQSLTWLFFPLRVGWRWAPLFVPACYSSDPSSACSPHFSHFTPPSWPSLLFPNQPDLFLPLDLCIVFSTWNMLYLEICMIRSLPSPFKGYLCGEDLVDHPIENYSHITSYSSFCFIFHLSSYPFWLLPYILPVYAMNVVCLLPRKLQTPKRQGFLFFCSPPHLLYIE